LKTKWQHIVESGNCPSIDQLKDYASGVLLPKERFEVENHLLTCDMCNDALEGHNLLEDSDQLPAIEQKLKSQLWQMLEQKEERTRKIILFRRLSIAASILLIVGVSVWLYQTNNRTEFNQLKIGQTIPPSEIKKKENKPNPVEEKSATTPEPIKIAQNQNLVKKTDALSREKSDERIFNAPAAHELIQQETEDSQTKSAEIAQSSPSEIEAKQPVLKKGKVVGKIKDNKGEPMPFVNLRIVGSNQYSVSDSKGNFVIEIPTDSVQIEASFLGYMKSTVTAKSETNLDITLKEELMALEEVRIVGSKVSGSPSANQKRSNESVKEMSKIRTDSNNSIARISKEEQSKPDNQPGQMKSETPLSSWELQKSKVIHNVQLNNYQEAIMHLDTLLQLTLNANKKTDIQNIVELLKQKKSGKALRLLKSLQQE
jgi:hypothetical protein